MLIDKIFIHSLIHTQDSGSLPQTSDMENFAAASRSRCHQLVNVVDNVVVDGRVVDDTYATIDESWLFTTSRSTVTL